jgi:hypothetical protein
MTLRGRVSSGVVVLEDGAQLPEGTLVTVQPVESPPKSAEDDALYRLADLAAHTGIPDLARNIDHYLYGHPKVSDAGQ